jgi:hypothetical protein
MRENPCKISASCIGSKSQFFLYKSVLEGRAPFGHRKHHYVNFFELPILEKRQSKNAYALKVT